MATIIVRKQIKRGDTWKGTFSWFAGSYPLDLTDCTARLQLRTKKVYELILEASTTGGEITIPDPIMGVMELVVDSAVMEAIDPAVYLCDIEVVYADGSVQSSETFEVEVLEDIAHD